MPQLLLYDPDTLAPLDAEATTNADAGTTSASQRVLLANHLGEVSGDVAMGYGVQALARLDGASPWRTSGVEILDAYAIEVRVAEGYGSLTVATPGPWHRLGPGRLLELPVLGPDEGVVIEVRVDLPAFATPGDHEVLLRPVRQASNLQPGLSREQGSGVLLGLGQKGLGRPALPTLLRAGDVVPNPAGADDQVQVPDLLAVVGGRPWARVEALVQLDDVDGDGVVLVAGNAYAALLCVGVGGLVVTKGVQDAEPLADTARPAVPAGCLPLAWVERSADGVIQAEDVANVWQRGDLYAEAQGLALNVSPGRALVGDVEVVFGRGGVVLADETADQGVWLQADGSLEVVVGGGVPAVEAVPLWRASTVAGGVEVLVDLRRYRGYRAERLELRIPGPLVVGAEVQTVLPGPCDLLPWECGLLLEDLGVNATAGAVVVDLEVLEGGAWTSVYTSQVSGGPDRGLRVAWDGPVLSWGESLPEVLQVDGAVALRARVREVLVADSSVAEAVVVVGVGV